MNRPNLRRNAAVFAIAAAAFAQVQAQATDAPRSRDQVRAELAEAQRNGELLTAGELALSTRDRQPASGSGLSRAEVRAEVLRAQRSGTLVAAGESLDPYLTHTPQASPTQLAGKTRAQVKAEFAEAQRSGDLLVAGESALTQREVAARNRGTPLPTAPVLAEAGAPRSVASSKR
jgi:hypothetical protein